jgi:hypothetical protein
MIQDARSHEIKKLAYDFMDCMLVCGDRGKVCVTNHKVAGSIPDGVMEFFIDVHPSDSTRAMRSTQPLTEMSTRRISWR